MKEALVGKLEKKEDTQDIISSDMDAKLDIGDIYCFIDEVGTFSSKEFFNDEEKFFSLRFAQMKLPEMEAFDILWGAKYYGSLMRVIFDLDV